jgi:hypothetical protein
VSKYCKSHVVPISTNQLEAKDVPPADPAESCDVDDMEEEED